MFERWRRDVYENASMTNNKHHTTSKKWIKEHKKKSAVTYLHNGVLMAVCNTFFTFIDVIKHWTLIPKIYDERTNNLIVLFI